VLEQPGVVRVFPNDPEVDDAAVFLDIRDRVRTEHNEEGLLGLAFDPSFAHNGTFYLYYSASQPRRVVVSRWRVSSDPNVADPKSERVLLEVNQPYGNHNGGTLVFGPDGKLYIGLGDGGAAGDPELAGQDLSTRLAKILRYAVDDSRGLVVPPDNPFVGKDGARGEIWCYGMRNPWRIAFDRANGDLWCGDVGQNRIEEVDRLVKGGNYGWNVMEGTEVFNRRVAPSAPPEAIAPVAEYGHRQGLSITGGHVYRGERIPGLQGFFVYGDFMTLRMWACKEDRAGGKHEVVTLPRASQQVSSFAEEPDGELLFTGFGGRDGRVWRLVPAK
jgi:glucose/arabinose dehydrogenase